MALPRASTTKSEDDKSHRLIHRYSSNSLLRTTSVNTFQAVLLQIASTFARGSPPAPRNRERKRNLSP